MGIEFKKKTYISGTSTVVTLPEELQNFLKMKAGDIIVMRPEENKKKQKFIALWKEEREGE